MILRPTSSAAGSAGKASFRSAHKEGADRKVHRDRALDCVAIANQKGWYDARGVPIDCQEITSHGFRSFDVLKDDWYNEKFDQVCGTLIAPDGSKREVKNFQAIGVDREKRVVCVPPGVLPNDASADLIRYAFLHQTLFKHATAGKRGVHLEKYAAQAMEAKKPKDFLDVLLDMFKSLKKKVGQVITLKATLRLLITGMVLFVVGAHFVKSSKYNFEDVGNNFFSISVQDKLTAKIKEIKDLGKQAERSGYGYTEKSKEEMGKELERVAKHWLGEDFWKKHQWALKTKYLQDDGYDNPGGSVGNWWSYSDEQKKRMEKYLTEVVKKLGDARADTHKGTIELPSWLVSLAKTSGIMSRKLVSLTGFAEGGVEWKKELDDKSSLVHSINETLQGIAKTFPGKAVLSSMVSAVSAAVSTIGSTMSGVVHRTAAKIGKNAAAAAAAANEAEKAKDAIAKLK